MKMTKMHQLQISIFFALQLIFFNKAMADDLTIVGVKRNITLADDEPVFHDLIVNTGENGGIKKGQIFTAFRRVGIRDFSGVQSYGEIDIPVGEIKILSVYSRVAVARQLKLYSREENPVLDVFGLMSGDRLEAKK
ncbi:MAG: hypothetical protein ACK5P5_08400 [Pseudobdellovibrionaceae bacterium]